MLFVTAQQQVAAATASPLAVLAPADDGGCSGTSSNAVPPPRVDVDKPSESKLLYPMYSPYTDDLEAGYEPEAMLQSQHQMMDGV